MKDLDGAYHTVYNASPKSDVVCMRTLSVPISNFTEPVSAVRLTLDQRTREEWNGIDAVRLLGSEQLTAYGVSRRALEFDSASCRVA